MLSSLKYGAPSYGPVYVSIIKLQYIIVNSSRQPVREAFDKQAIANYVCKFKIQLLHILNFNIFLTSL